MAKNLQKFGAPTSRLETDRRHIDNKLAHRSLARKTLACNSGTEEDEADGARFGGNRGNQDGH